MLRSLRSLALAASLLLIAASAFAGPATDTLKGKQARLVQLLTQSKSAENTKQVNVVFDETLDYARLSEDSLGSEWANRSDAEKAEFSDLLKQLVRKSYERNLRKTLNYNVEYTTEEESKGKLIVKTKAKHKTDDRQEPIEIDYTMADTNGWRVQDIKTEGVSMVGSYRSQFVRIIKKDGFPTLIKKMKDKLAKGDV